MNRGLYVRSGPARRKDPARVGTARALADGVVWALKHHEILCTAFGLGMCLVLFWH